MEKAPAMNSGLASSARAAVWTSLRENDAVVGS
jgi:hypothetical protein